MSWKKVFAVCLAVAMIAGVVAGCNGEDPDETSKETDGTTSATSYMPEPVKVGVLYISQKDDGGWSQSHARGFEEAVAAIGDAKVELVELESVAYGDAAVSEAAVRQLVEAGCKIIFATSFGFMDTIELMAEEFEDVKFEHCSGTKSNDTNFDNYFGQVEQGRYLTGIMAGYATEANKIGYVAAFPFAEVLRGINAFALGVQSVNPDAEVIVEFTMSWFNPEAEGENAVALINRGVDVMAQHQDSPAAISAAEEAGILAIGYNNPMGHFAPEGYLSAPLFNWGAYYEMKIREFIEGTWSVDNFWGGLESGVVAIDEMTENVPEEAKAKVEEIKELLKEQNNDYIFTGPITDQDGNIVVEEGQTLTREEQYAMDFLVEGVIGDIS